MNAGAPSNSSRGKPLGGGTGGSSCKKVGQQLRMRGQRSRDVRPFTRCDSKRRARESGISTQSLRAHAVRSCLQLHHNGSGACLASSWFQCCAAGLLHYPPDTAQPQRPFVKSERAILRFMLPPSGLPRKPKIWYRNLANMGVTVLFGLGVEQLLSQRGI